MVKELKNELNEELEYYTSELDLDEHVKKNDDCSKAGTGKHQACSRSSKKLL